MFPENITVIRTSTNTQVARNSLTKSQVTPIPNSKNITCNLLHIFVYQVIK